MKTTLLEPEIVTRKGKPVSVILPITHYKELLERLEDIEDVAWLKRACKKPQQCRPLEDYLAGAIFKEIPLNRVGRKHGK